MTTDFTTINTVLAAIPESLELLVFGIGLIVAVVALRWFLNRGGAEKKDEEFTKKSPKRA